MPARTISAGVSPWMGRPSQSTSPAKGWTRPRMLFMVVDLPDALPPSRQTSSPSPTVSETSQSTCTWP